MSFIAPFRGVGVGAGSTSRIISTGRLNAHIRTRTTRPIHTRTQIQPIVGARPAHVVHLNPSPLGVNAHHRYRSAGSGSTSGSGSAQLHTTAAACMASRKKYTNTERNQGKEEGSSVQAVDDKLAEAQRQAEQARRSGPQLDYHALSVPIIDRSIDPPLQLSWAFRKGGLKYLWERFKRRRQDILSLNEMIKFDMFEKNAKPGFIGRIIAFYRNTRPSARAARLLDELNDIYARFHVAQARGDVAAIKKLSVDQAHDKALYGARSAAASGIEWRLVSVDKPTKLLLARLFAIDPANKITCSQVVARFETTQSVTVTQKGERKTRQQRVAENWVFERKHPVREDWRIKERIEYDKAPF